MPFFLSFLYELSRCHLCLFQCLALFFFFVLFFFFFFFFGGLSRIGLDAGECPIVSELRSLHAYLQASTGSCRRKLTMDTQQFCGQNRLKQFMGKSNRVGIKAGASLARTLGNRYRVL